MKMKEDQRQWIWILSWRLRRGLKKWVFSVKLGISWWIWREWNKFGLWKWK